MNLHPLSRRAKGSIALLATTAFGLALVGPAAFADTNPLVDTTKAPGTLYITKMIQPTPAPTTQANGMQQTPPSSTLNGITFTAYPVLYPNALGVPSPIDLSTPAGWQDAAGGPDANEYDVEGGTSTDPDYTLGTALPACTSTGGYL